MSERNELEKVPGLMVPGLLPAARYPLTAGYWIAADEGRLVIQRCTECGTHRHPPAPACYRCQSFQWDWHQVSGAGQIFSYTWVHAALTQAFVATVPYNVCVVELADTDGVRIASTVTGVNEGDDLIGSRVQGYFADAGGGNKLLLFAGA
ncbi:OB-fold domain-containing protein [Jatrophihabitans sp.]|uniref:Zn-ribbon domain-containing OB-fold protein n=1 Tax=Jatrophihabitans sp. TaxID=1932789 RepID=UPI0030C67E30|nr:hypothetical protein [Jatrophihabitans sp.]